MKVKGKRHHLSLVSISWTELKLHLNADDSE